MYKYLAMVWDNNDQNKIHDAQLLLSYLQNKFNHWCMVHNKSGLVVFHKNEDKGLMQCHHMANNQGVILGKVFKKTKNNAYSSLDCKIPSVETQEIIKSGGRYLIDQYWGRYVAFFIERNNTINVIKSPIEGWRCYYITIKGVTLYFSCLEDISKINDLGLSIKWKHIAIHIKYFFYNIWDTAFNEIAKLQPGEKRTHEKDRVASTMYWNPISIAQSRSIEDPNEAIDLFRETLISCVSAWASGYDRIIHKLSGGLDSSIVLACLIQSRSTDDIVCLNMFSNTDKGADERRFARMAAEQYGVRLIEKELDASTVKMEKLFDISPLPTPEWYLNALDRTTYEAELAGELNANGLFGGEGGDGLFYQPVTHYIANDYWKQFGLKPSLFNVTLDVARQQKKSVWSVLYRVLQEHISPSCVSGLISPHYEDNILINDYENANIDLQNTLTVSLDELCKISYAKAFHILISGQPNKYHHTARAVDFLEVCYPIMSQPMIELCLQIPSYIHMLQGKSRGLARYAFKDLIPLEIAQRESKGGLRTYTQDILTYNIDFIRDILLNGLLTDQSLLNIENLKTLLSGTQTAHYSYTTTILQLACTEIWLRKITNEYLKISD